MNKLPLEKRAQILNLLCEGSSMRAISRVCDVSINTVSKLLEDAGFACADAHDRLVRGVKAKNVQCDEIWSFVYSKQKNVPTAKAAPEGAGDVWTWTALDRDSKLIVSYLVGPRNAECAAEVMSDLSDRLDGKIQLSTDGLRLYVSAVEAAFDDIDYGMLEKVYGAVPENLKGRYSPAECIGARRQTVLGEPDKNKINTSHVEKHNQSMRQHMRRFTRLTNGHSKKFANHCHMVALYTLWYNFVRINSAVRMPPAMAAGISDHLWSMADIVKLIDEAAPATKKRGPYKKSGEVSRQSF